MFTFFFFEKLENSEDLWVFEAFTLAKINLENHEPIPWNGKKMSYVILLIDPALEYLKDKEEG